MTSAVREPEQAPRSSPVFNAAGRGRIFGAFVLRWPRVLPLALGAILIACTSSSATGSACASAGGTCGVGVPVNCARQAASSAQDCNTNPPNPGGGFCCLEFQEGGFAQQDGSVSDGGGTTDGASGDGALPSCTWPASLDDAAPRQCSAARAYLACQYPDGGGYDYDCMSNDPSTCPAAPGASCTDLCNADEYAVGCGGVGPAPSPPLPTGCRGLPSGPGGGVVGCCPCGAAGTVADGGASGSVSDAGQDVAVTDAGPITEAGGDAGPCTTDADCGSGRLCGFLESAGCSATGTCFPAPGVVCNAIVLACACDGTNINVACNGLPSGYAPKPFAHSGVCGFDSGGGD